MIKRSAAMGSCGVLVAAALLAQTPSAGAAALPVQAHPDVALAAGATVLTLEGGVVGLQHLLHFTPLQLRGDLCELPNVCTPMNSFAMPLGQWFNDQGAVKLNEAVAALPDDGTPIVLYGHSQAGDLRGLFSHWFDTRTGAKQESASYTAIAAAMGCDPAQVLFISDAVAELEAADRAGLAGIFSDRPGNPGRDSGQFERINDYNQLKVNDDERRS